MMRHRLRGVFLCYACLTQLISTVLNLIINFSPLKVSSWNESSEPSNLVLVFPGSTLYFNNSYQGAEASYHSTYQHKKAHMPLRLQES